MQIPIISVADIGLLIRSTRRASGVRLDDLASTAGLSKQFVSDVEHGKPTVQLGLVLKLLAELGMPMTLDIPDEAFRQLDGVRKRAQKREARKASR
jgi:transcriptional regulator with XRE-family HTH domain